MNRRLPVLLIVSFLSVSSSHAADFQKLFERTDPSVVVLYTVERQAAPNTALGEVALPGLGSGFLIDEEGHIMTAAHVVQTADLVQAQFPDGTKIPAAIVASDPVNDVALLKLDRLPENLRHATLGDSDRVAVGEEVFVIGAPLGLSHTLTVGHISARHPATTRDINGIQAETFQTDAAINQGNSGGPLFNKRGEVIGIVSYIRSLSGGSDGLGFAVTINAAVAALFERRMSWSGMSGLLLTGEIAEALNIPQPSGYLVQKVASNSPAARAGLRPSRVPVRIAGQDLFIGGDIILSVNDIAMEPNMMPEFREMTERLDPGASVELRVLRGGQVISLMASFGN
jgi:S1-C subfamily serine protease